MDRFYTYLDKKVIGPFEVPELFKLHGFSLQAPVCALGEKTWQPADQFPTIRFHIASPESLKRFRSNDLRASAPINTSHPKDTLADSPIPKFRTSRSFEEALAQEKTKGPVVFSAQVTIPNRTSTTPISYVAQNSSSKTNAGWIAALLIIGLSVLGKWYLQTPEGQVISRSLPSTFSWR